MHSRTRTHTHTHRYIRRLRHSTVHASDSTRKEKKKEGKRPTDRPTKRPKCVEPASPIVVDQKLFLGPKVLERSSDHLTWHAWLCVTEFEPIFWRYLENVLRLSIRLVYEPEQSRSKVKITFTDVNRSPCKDASCRSQLHQIQNVTNLTP